MINPALVGVIALALQFGAEEEDIDAVLSELSAQSPENATEAMQQVRAAVHAVAVRKIPPR